AFSSPCNLILDPTMQLGLWKFLIKIGKQIVSIYRVELVPLLIPQEIEMLAIQSVLRMNTRKDFESKLGKPIYSFTIYQKIKRVTITLENKEYPIFWPLLT
ncbi:MAG: hypothetical protein QOK64_09700, partial [Nitrososphaeraceae archaeon]|nr:hypothetical protein [Nitrososphaeraceae archaeon]